MKYRVYNIKDGWFFNPKDCLMDGNGQLIEPKEIGFYDFFETSYSTGILDENRQEIYEGDIVEYDGREGRAEVKYDKDDGSFYLDAGKNLSWIDVFSDKRRWYRCKIVGNIYENPELLK